MARYKEFIENVLINWANNNTGLTFIWDKQNVIRPSLPYGTLAWLTTSEIEQEPDFGYEREDVFSHIYREIHTITANIYCSSRNGEDNRYLYYMELLKRSFDQWTKRKPLIQQGVFFRSQNDINDISALIDTDYELRCANDFVFATAEKIEENLEEIKRVTITNGFQIDVEV